MFATSSNSDELWLRFHQALKPFGVTNLFYAVGHLSETLTLKHLSKLLETNTDLHPFHFKTSYPSELANTSEQKYRVEKDLSALHCLMSTKPFVWDSQSKWACTTDRYADLASESYWYSVKLVGVTIPLRFGEYGKGGVGMYMSKLSSREFDEMWGRCHEEIISIAYQFDEVVRSDFLSLINIELTQRERDILAWVAQGFSAKLIADILGTKPNTVQNQIVNLRAKLTARNNVQMVTIATMFKLI